MNIWEAYFSPSLSNGDFPRTRILKTVRKHSMQALHVKLLKSKGFTYGWVGFLVKANLFSKYS